MINLVDSHEANGHPPPGLYDVELERLLVNALICDPSRQDRIEISLTDFIDPHSYHTFKAFSNVRARGPVTRAAVRKELADTGIIAAVSGLRADPDRGWFDELFNVEIDDIAPVVGWSVQLLTLAARRQQAIDEADATVREQNEIDDQALRDAEPAPVISIVKPPVKRLGRTWEDCVAEIYARKDEPWIDLRVGSAVIATCRNGSFIPLVAPSGAGKSTLVIQMLIDHAMNRGPAVYLTYELDGDEAVARAVGQLCSYGWASVLRGEVPRESIPAVDRLRVLERDEATLENLARVIAELRLLYPDQPVFVVVDYMQATPAPPGKERGYTANVSVELRRAAKRNRVVLVGVSQASTENSKKLRAGELLGIDTSATGAETAQIERDAYVILTLSARKPVDDDTISWKLSTAKYRLGIADVVQELHYRGRLGTWEPVGQPISGSDAREAQASGKDDVKRAELRRSIVALVDASPVAMSKRSITEQCTGKAALIGDVIKELVRDRELVHVAAIGLGGGRPLWTPRHLILERDSDD